MPGMHSPWNYVALQALQGRRVPFCQIQKFTAEAQHPRDRRLRRLLCSMVHSWKKQGIDHLNCWGYMFLRIYVRIFEDIWGYMFCVLRLPWLFRNHWGLWDLYQFLSPPIYGQKMRETMVFTVYDQLQGFPLVGNLPPHNMTTLPWMLENYRPFVYPYPSFELYISINLILCRLNSVHLIIYQYHNISSFHRREVHIVPKLVHVGTTMP